MNKICRIVTKFSFNWYRITNWPIPVNFLSGEKSWHHFLIVLKLECHFLNIKGQLIIKDLKTAVIHYFFIALSRVTEKKLFTPILSKIVKKNTKNVNQSQYLE